MDGVHDLGGMHGFGPVVREHDEPPFHEPWEGRVHGMLLALGAGGHLPAGFRHAIERMDAAHYLSSPYYEHWLVALRTLVTEHGLLDAGRPPGTPAPPELVRALLAPPPGGVKTREQAAARFAAGDAVVVRRDHPAGHTRLPRYVRGAVGRVVRTHPAAPLPDVLVAAGMFRIEPVYSVEFEARALWGADAEPRSVVVVDLWESYLEQPAGEGS